MAISWLKLSDLQRNIHSLSTKFLPTSSQRQIHIQCRSHRCSLVHRQGAPQIVAADGCLNRRFQPPTCTSFRCMSADESGNENGGKIPSQPKLGFGTSEDHFDFIGPVSTSQAWMSKIIDTMLIYPNFITPEEEINIMKEVEPYISRLHYETSHWDDAINDYRETERSTWNKKNMSTIDKIRATAFPPTVPQLKLVHVLDLAQKGLIKPHIDSVRFCGNTIAGLSLLSDCVMRLRHEAEKDIICDVYLPQYSLYVMSGFARYEFTHEILGETESTFKGKPIARKRRISIMCRNEPPPESSAASGPVFVPFTASASS